MPSASTPTAESVLQQSGLRRTPVRLGVIDLLMRSGRPMSVPHILAKMKGTVDTVTVYRTLHAFVRKKLVHRVRGSDRSWLYAISVSDERPQHLHPHFVCDDCGKVECLEHVQIPHTLLSSLGVNGKYKVRWPEVVLHGLCPKCHL
ncbi:MAG TPA: Fur family transcriptional regulator [Tepidisphaeraceae bacterium]|nr:Fur family transcriptional regulator [Tepidisphaeraceae bacterium]